MAEPYLGQIEAFAFNFAPKGWATCAGQTMSINQNQALFSLLGTTYGGDGRVTFALPDLRSRVTMGQGNGVGLTPRSIGERTGEESHTLLSAEIPSHTHSLNTAANADPATNKNAPGNTEVLAQSTGKDKDGNVIALNLYVADPNPTQPMATAAIGLTGGQPHSNLMPLSVVNFCIALQGIFPSRN
jgi:microcystin-dependent protein